MSLNLSAGVEEAPRRPGAARPAGRIQVFPAVVAAISGHAAAGCYGVRGMADRGLRDGVATLLRRENLHRGVDLREVPGGLAVDAYVIVQYGVRITEVAHNLQMAVRFEVERATGVSVAEVNVYVQGVHGDNWSG
ncbi:MAG: Asp23/Gls24 family envelope stress response protein [Candidatus Dormibacteraeota bacterium]|nr:Asp23/Gls24 family envelope stress response protein [Candidatus Dormibacteraeota bacterium]